MEKTDSVFDSGVGIRWKKEEVKDPEILADLLDKAFKTNRAGLVEATERFERVETVAGGASAGVANIARDYVSLRPANSARNLIRAQNPATRALAIKLFEAASALALQILSSADASLFSVDASGNVSAAGNIAAAGNLSGVNATLTGDLSAVDGEFSGDIEAVAGTFTGNLSGVQAVFSGDISADNATFFGDMEAINGTFNGDVEAINGDFSGDVTADGGTFAATVIADSFSGNDVIADEGSFSVLLTALEALLNGKLTLRSVFVDAGDGSPEGVVAAPQGSLFLRRDGSGTGETLYIKESGSGDTGWVVK